MTFERAIEYLNNLLEKEQPRILTSSWIFYKAQHIYHFFRINLRTETNDVDWDAVTRHLNRSFQTRWRQRGTRRLAYEDQQEVDAITNKHRPRFYVFIAPQDEKDRFDCDTISIELVRLAQRGNMLAHQEILKLVRLTIEQWIEYDPQIIRWRGFESEIEKQIDGCIRRYRYSGSFIGYLHRTLECVGRGFPPPAVSIDRKIKDGKGSFADHIVKDEDSGEIRFSYNQS